MRRRAVVAMGQGVLGAVLVCTAARASELSPVEKALAETLFQEGKRLLAEGDVAGACDKLGKSQTIDPQVGTLLNLAVCHEQQGKTASAWAEFREAKAQAARSGQDERLELAQQHIAALEPRLSRIVVRVQAPAAQQVVALEGRPIGRELWGEAMPVDPGKLRVEASAPGKIAWSQVVEVAGEASTTTVDVGALRDAPPPQRNPRVPDKPTPAPEGGSPRKAIGWAVGGVGVGALLVGGWFGIQALSTKSEGDDHCVGIHCDAVGLERMSTGRDQATASTIFLGAGAALTAAGAVLVLTAPSATPARRAGLALSPTGASLWVAQ